MKLLTLTILSAFFLIGTTSTSTAHCGACGEKNSHTEMSKPCTKCAKAGEKCGCGDKKEKICTSGMKTDKPCAICDASEKKWKMKKTQSKMMSTSSEKGSLRIINDKPLNDPYND